ncbi:hypothetical protein [Vibrio sp. SCSIO 43137]|uniref:hypothetical protein n=1 Tax=Vibrio sp. SCSIO 43137 TaxID=3021011 RepID=UPI0023076DBB|nr:hypothetical protein [Vibrio sp. SCSIO 43137]WCE28795.1 hypothetical protein PK654_10535 [Vibrio sp. SCSIO 43137]
MKNNGLKNWVVVAKPVQGLNGMIARERYLMSQHRHKNSKIISLIGNATTSKKIILKGERYLLKQRIERKGGRPISSFAVELSLSLPPSLERKPTPEQWKQIAINCSKAVANYLKLSPQDKQEFYSHVRCVLHDQSNPHVHLILCKIINDKVLHDLQRKRCIAVAKESFTASVHQICGIAINDYKPHELNRGKRIDKWKYQRQKAEEVIAEAKQLKTIENQISKWFEAYRESDFRQMNRQVNRMRKTYLSLPDNARNNQNLIYGLSKIEKTSGKSISNTV